MSGAVWVSSVLSNFDIGMKQGTRTKFYGHDWNPATLDLPISPSEVRQASDRHMQGFALERGELPEAEAVFDEKRFRKIGDIFMVGPFYAVKGKLAEALSRFDLGEGGLVPLPIYKGDLVTSIEGQFFLLNFGARKNSILPEQCEDARKFYVDKGTGQQVWKINYTNYDGEVVLSSAALDGPDLWFEAAAHNKIFMKDALAQALIEIGMDNVFKLKPCRIIDSAQ